MRFNIRWKLYKLINKNPYKSSYDLAEMLGIKHKRIHKYLERLLKDNLIKFERYIPNTESKWGFYPIPWQELINWDEMNTNRNQYKNNIKESE